MNEQDVEAGIKRCLERPCGSTLFHGCPQAESTPLIKGTFHMYSVGFNYGDLTTIVVLNNSQAYRCPSSNQIGIIAR